MGIYLNPENDGFKRALNSEIYVDKSRLIEYTNSVINSEQEYICASRPRRFGKSMAANMLVAYYSRGCDSLKLFDNLKISKEKSYKEHLNQYDVLFLNIQHFLSGAKSPDNLAAYIEKTILEELRNIYKTWVPDKEERLSETLASVFCKDKREKKGFIFIIDEWDCIFREDKKNKKAQKIYLDFLKDLLKDRTYVRLAYMTGILPIKKYGTHSALNIFNEFSMTEKERLAEFAGFTEMEVEELCLRYNMDFEEAKKWYDGYQFKGIKHIYNPKSVVDAMTEGEFRSYWAGTETYEALKIYIDMNFDGLKDAIISMIGGARCKINVRKFQNDMTSFTSKDDVLALLIHLGYLAYDGQTQEVFIPNMEVLEEFKNTAEGTKGWEHLSEALINSENLLEATLNQDSEAVAKGISLVHTDNTSVLSYNNENSLSCVITVAYFSAQKDYTLVREMPAGQGFADIVFLPRRHTDKPALVVELKWNQTEQGAIKQIKNKQYVKALEEYSGNLLLVGINYDKKNKKHNCIIEKFKKL